MTADKKRRAWFRIALGVIGLGVVALVVNHVGAGTVLATLRGALPWLPLLCLLELGRIVSESAATYLGYGPAASKIPRWTLLRAHVMGHSLGAVAPAPSVVAETIKATLLTPYVGVEAATSVAVLNQAAIFLSVGLFSIPCALAILTMTGSSIWGVSPLVGGGHRASSLWFWACAIHAVVLVSCGVGLRAITRADAPGRWPAKRFPKLAPRAEAFQAQARVVGLWAGGPTGALLVGRCFQATQFGVAALAVGIAPGIVGALSAQGVNLVAVAVGVLVPAGLGTTDGAFTLAAGLLHTTVVRATSLALLMRCVQLVWVAIASVLALAAGRTRSATPDPARS